MFQVNHHASKATKPLKTVLIIVLVFAAVPVASLVTSPDEVQALCETDGVQQTWLNVDPGTGSIRRVEIFFPCNDTVLVGIGGPSRPTPTPVFEYAASVKLYGACEPTDCEWEEIKLYRRRGRNTDTTVMYGYHDHGFATRRLTVELQRDKSLTLTMRTHFTDRSGRRDYTSTDRFFRARGINIVASHSGKCLDVSGASRDNGAVTHQWDCRGKGQQNQLWTLRPVRDGYYQIVAAHSMKCLDVSEVSRANGAVAHQWECVGPEQANQLWSLKTVGDNYQLVAKHTGKCLDVDVSRAPYANGAVAQQWECLGAQQTNQLWKLHPAR